MRVSKLLKKVGIMANKNRTALRALQRLGYTMPSIRKSLLDLNSIKLKELSGEVSMVTISHVMQGKRVHRKAQRAIANALSLSVKELFSI